MSAADASTVCVHLFARARELAGVDSLSISVSATATVGELRRRLGAEQPRLAALVARSAIAVNNEFAEDALPLPPGAEIALLPPVSGGSALLEEQAW